MQILLINLHSFQNAGDAALAETAMQQIKEQFPGCRFTLMMNDGDSYPGPEQVVTSIYNWVFRHQKNRALWFLGLAIASTISLSASRLLRRPVLSFIPKELHPSIRAFHQANLVISAPGGFLYSQGKGLAFLTFVFSMALAILAGKPLYIFPQSIGPFHNWRDRSAIKWLLKRTRMIMVRESASLQFLSDSGISTAGIAVLPDMAFAFEGVDKPAAQAWLTDHGVTRSPGEPLIGLTILDWGAQRPTFQNQQDYEDAVVQSVQSFTQQKKGKVIIYAQCWGPSSIEDDRIPARRVANKLVNVDGAVFCFDFPVEPALLHTLYGELDLLIGSRMHSNIFALKQCVPVLAIAYLHKTRGIMETLDLEKWCLDVEDIEPATLTQMLIELWENRQSVRELLEISIPSVVYEAKRPGKLLLDDYTKFRNNN